MNVTRAKLSKILENIIWKKKSHVITKSTQVDIQNACFYPGNGLERGRSAV